MICPAISPMTLLTPPRPCTVSTYDTDINSSRRGRLLSLSSTRVGEAPSSCAALPPRLTVFVLCLRPHSRSYCNSSINKYNDSTHAYDIVRHIYSSLAGRSARLDLYGMCGIPDAAGQRISSGEASSGTRRLSSGGVDWFLVGSRGSGCRLYRRREALDSNTIG